ARCLSCSGLLPELSRFGGRLAQTYDCLDLAARQQGVEPLISIIDERWAPAGCCRDTAVDTVEEGVDQHIAPGHPKLSEKPLEALPSLSHEDASHDGFMLSRILADNQHSRGAIQAPSVEDRSPFDPELVGGVDIRFGIVRNQSAKGLLAVATIVGVIHSVSPC